MVDAVAIIPARGGSKGVPRKNLAVVGGRPLIAWTIQAAREARSISRVVLTTEDDEIARIGRSSGAEVPFKRPVELASDSTPGTSPVLHAVRWLEEHEGYRPDLVMCLQPTSPLRTAADIDGAIEALHRTSADSLVSVTAAHPHPLWTKRLDEEGWLREFIPGSSVCTRRQDLPVAFALNGAIYLARRDVLLGRGSWYGDRTAPFVMPRERSLDVDTEWDLHLVALVLQDRIRRAAPADGSAR